MYSPGEDFELILTVKMETRHPVEGQFVSEFLAICNHYGQHSVPKVFIATPIDIVVSKIS